LREGNLVMAFQKKDGKKAKTFGVVAQRLFLEELARTSNITASAKAAGFTTKPAYDLKKKSGSFKAQWLEALSEGYARLEADLLAEALRPASPHLKDMTLKQKQLKVRLGMALLAAHRNTVRGAEKPSPSRSRDPEEVKKRLAARFTAMNKRLNDDPDSEE
jgi:hypothetical protein